MKKLLLPVLIVLAACTREPFTSTVNSSLILNAAGPTRAGDPDDTLISDFNLFIFNAMGQLEERVYMSERMLRLQGGLAIHRTTLLRDVPYQILAAANLGYELPFRSLEQARAYRLPLAHPDEFSRGLPMAAFLSNAIVGEDGLLEIPLERLMARVEFNMDRSHLQSGILLKVTEVRVGACPSSVQLIGPSKVERPDQTFAVGYLKAGAQVSPLNLDLGAGVSPSICLYLLENCQGNLLENVTSDAGKVLDEGPYQEICSYLEIKAQYHSDSWQTRPGETLTYRIYLGENLNNFDVCRNTWYSITMRPEGDGLGEESWRFTAGTRSATVRGSGPRKPPEESGATPQSAPETSGRR